MDPIPVRWTISAENPRKSIDKYSRHYYTNLIGILGLLKRGKAKMRISTKGRYGLRAMVDLASNISGDHVALNSIAERQGISANYLEQVFALLRKAGLVKSVKGAQGGYILANDPANVTVGSVLRALEGDLSVSEGSAETIDRNSLEYCIKTFVWEKIDESINGVVDSITLEDLVDEHKKLCGNQALMFYI